DHEEGEGTRHVRDDHQPEWQQRGPEEAEDPAQEAWLIGAGGQAPDGEARAGKQNRVGDEHDRQALYTDALQEVRVPDVGAPPRREGPRAPAPATSTRSSPGSMPSARRQRSTRAATAGL